MGMYLGLCKSCYKILDYVNGDIENKDWDSMLVRFGSITGIITDFEDFIEERGEKEAYAPLISFIAEQSEKVQLVANEKANEEIPF